MNLVVNGQEYFMREYYPYWDLFIADSPREEQIMTFRGTGFTEQIEVGYESVKSVAILRTGAYLSRPNPNSAVLCVPSALDPRIIFENQILKVFPLPLPFSEYVNDVDNLFIRECFREILKRNLLFNMERL
jgi:hypothetical protein